MKKLFIFLLAWLCSNFTLIAQSDSIFPEMKYRTWVMPYKTGYKQVLFELKDSSVMISNSARKRDYSTGHYTVSKLDVKNISEIKYAKKGKGYSILIGGASGFALGGAAVAIIYEDYKVKHVGEAFGNFFLAALIPVAAMGIGIGVGALISGPKRTIPVNGSQNTYDLYKARLNDIVLKNTLSVCLRDIDSNNYHAVIYHGKAWMIENLRVTRYRNGDSITQAKDSGAWVNARSGAMCWYRDDYMHNKKKGLLYNWMVVNDKRGLCPEGWHVATYEEWSILIAHMAGDDKSKTVTSTGKKNPFLDPEYNFTYRAGYRDKTGNFSIYPLNAQFWTSTSVDSVLAKALFLHKQANGIFFSETDKQTGLSVRCVRD
ncbi:MAG: fibrobacter succinogenes major paralogous domain-containing protein [Bacteroidetes bacterium]|nr:fibrobacter succinogenes major paralogous domain-containing protein [Bacteroidota bacterium]